MVERPERGGPRRSRTCGADRAGADSMRRMHRRVTPRPELPALITGGAGFIGTNVAARLLPSGRRARRFDNPSRARRVGVFDNLSRAGVEHNLRWLCDAFGDRVERVISDVRDGAAVAQAVA